MAKLLVLEKKQYVNGVVRLRRGDRWVIEAKITERIAGVDTNVDLTGAAVTGFLPAEDSADSDRVIAVSGTVVAAKAGLVQFAFEPAETALVQDTPDGSSMYATVDDGSGVYTVETSDEPLEVRDRGFNQF